MTTDSPSDDSIDTFADAYLDALRAAESDTVGVRDANSYLQRRFAASITSEDIQPTTPAAVELHTLEIGFGARCDLHTIGHGLETVVNDLYGETGSYYTPEEMVSFMVERTVHPKLRDAADIPERFDSIDEWISGASQPTLENGLEAVRDLTICDPACGSGHFLVGAHDELVRIQQRLHDELGLSVADWKIAKRVAEQNIYGVDIVPEAVRMAKLRLRLCVLEHLPTELATRYVGTDRERPAVVPA